jgi:hypothetical protein
MRAWSLLISTVLLWAIAGCGGDNPLGRKALQGTVTLDGAPIANGSIDFQPMQAGGVQSGGVITGGKYSIRAEQGLPEGKYRVAIHASDASAGALPAGAMPGDDVPPVKELVPEEWNSKSEHTIEVTSKSSQEFNFEISTKPQ